MGVVGNPNPLPMPPGPGRPPGRKARAREMALENFRRAVEVCHEAKQGPPDLLMETVQIIRLIALAPVSNAQGLEAQRAAILQLTEADKDRLIRRLVEGSGVLLRLMEFAYPKLQRIDHEFSGGLEIQNKQHMVVELKITDDRPTLDLDAGEDELLGAQMNARPGNGSNGGRNGGGGTPPVPH